MNAVAVADASTARTVVPPWVAVVGRYKRPETWRATWQLTSTVLLYFVGLTAGYLALDVGYWLTLLIAIPTGGLVTRLFVLQHDCGHGSLFPSKRVNETVGKWLGVLTFSPFEFWRKSHAIHHATSGDLARRGTGDVNTLTIREYEALSPWGKRGYWLYRHPLVLFGVFPMLLFGFRFRMAYRPEPAWHKEYWSVYRTNIFIALFALLACVTVGWRAWFAVQVPVLWVAATVGVWLFYVQHQYEATYWAQPEDWDYYRASIQGSSNLRLSKPFQWFTANIGVHHVHHLCPAIPNYHLQRCHREIPEMHLAKDLGVREALGAAFLTLWDEEQQRLISFREHRRRRAAAAVATA